MRHPDVVSPVGDVPELAHVLAAMRRGTRRSRLRILEVVCRNGHRLAEVYPTGTGPVVLIERARHDHGHDGPGAIRLDDIDPAGAGVWAGCRCTYERITDAVIRFYIEAGTRRVVLRDGVTGR